MVEKKASSANSQTGSPARKKKQTSKKLSKSLKPLVYTEDDIKEGLAPIGSVTVTSSVTASVTESVTERVTPSNGTTQDSNRPAISEPETTVEAKLTVGDQDSNSRSASEKTTSSDKTDKKLACGLQPSDSMKSECQTFVSGCQDCDRTVKFIQTRGRSLLPW